MFYLLLKTKLANFHMLVAFNMNGWSFNVVMLMSVSIDGWGYSD